MDTIASIAPTAPAVDELNKVFERVEQERIYSRRAETELASIAEQVTNGGTSVLDGLKKARAVEQDLEANRKKIKKKAFTVYSLDENGNRIEYSDLLRKPFEIGIHIEDLPISEEKADFKVEVDRTMLVINQVLKPKQDVPRWHLNSDPNRRSDYIRGLRGICHVGLEHEDASQLKLATKSLESFREEFVANEAGAVKNRYLWRLGVRCLAMSVLASLAYVYASSLGETHIIYRFRNFFILVAGAGVGTWLSFALRRVIVTFLDLAALEEDRLDPTLRVLFITALTSIVGLFIWTGAISLGVGKFTTAAFPNSGVTTLLIGLLLGIAERTMATSVQKRATEFGAGIFGK